MSEGSMSAVKQALVAVEEMRAELDAIDRARREPIAIVGMACRFPGGADTPEAFWRVLDEGVDAVTEVPPERWSLPPAGSAIAPADRAARWGAFLRDVDRFEPRFFGISPREAAAMDPQQRLLLEVAWEALERAGIVPERLAGSRAGVFLGLMNDDYKQLSGAADPASFDLHTSTGNGHCFAAGRLSYVLGLEGPCLTVDTACSSSLVAVHLACQSLRAGESDVALAGGVNLMLAKRTSELVSRLEALSPDGRCKTFDAEANGYVRGEGAGLVALKRLSDALRDGDHVLASIRGSAVNQDGRSTGFTAPNVLSQEALLRQALAAARVSPEEIGFVETHGTGTALGDPIEVEALAGVLGRPRADGTTIALGALKSNVGHLEAAAGIASLIKAVLVLTRGVIPRNLHFRTQNPRISLAGTALTIASERRAWVRSDRPRFAGVSSFGLSGTNAHVVLEEAPEAAPREAGDARRVVLLPLSAKGPEALADLARAHRERLAEGAGAGVSLVDAAHTAGARRGHHAHRLAVIGGSREEIGAALDAFARSGEAPPGGSVGARHTGGRMAKIAFVFPGHGSQRAGMGRELVDREPAFRAVIEACDREIRAQAGWSLLDEVRAGFVRGGRSSLDAVDVVQSSLFAIELALATLWRSWGIEPDAVVGHSMGEVAAACFAGALSLGDAVRIMCTRTRLLGPVAGKGAMLAVELSPAEARRAIEGREGRVFVAILNGPRSTVISGDPEAIAAAETELARQGVRCRRVRSDVAFHCPRMDPLRAPYAEALAGIAPVKADVPLISTVTGERIEGDALGPDYWARNLREPVQFARAVDRLVETGHEVFVEMSPHPILLASIEEGARAAGRGEACVVLPSLRRDQEEQRTLLESLGAVYARGADVAWERVGPGVGRCVELPTYRWQRGRYWIGGAEERSAERQSAAGWSAEEQSSKERSATESSARSEDVLREIRWEVTARRSATTTDTTGRWLLVAEAGGIAERIARRLDARGGAGVRVGDDAALGAALDAHAWRGVVLLGGIDRDEGDPVAACAALLETTKAVARRGSTAPRLWLVTRGAQAAGADTSIAAAASWGLGRVIASEHADLRFCAVDLGMRPTDDDVAALVELLREDGSEEQIALRDGARLVPRIAPIAHVARPRGGAALRAGGSYLITGGLGALGIAVASWMADRGAGHLVLMGRNPPGAAAEGAIDAMRRAGARVSVELGDVAREDDVARALGAIDASPAPLRGVVHAAGVLDDGLLEGLDAARLRRVLAPKIAGAEHLHRLTAARPLDFFVLFSSLAAWLGLPGQGSYAAANAALDAIAEQRRALGLPAVSVGWAGWSGLGFAAASERALAHLTRRGLARLAPAEALEIFGRVISGGGALPARVLTLPIDGAAIEAERRIDGASRWLALLGHEAIAEAPRALPDGAARGREARARDEIQGARPAARQRALLEDHVRAQIARVLRLPAAEIGRDTPMRDLGMDSFMAVELRRRLEVGLGLALSATLVWQRPTVAELTLHLAGALGVGEPARDDAALPAAENAGIERLLEEIEGLSDEDARRLLEGPGAAAGG